MITARTKRQLLIFVIITLVGISYVGARYAKLDRLVRDTTYEVNAHFKESGGIFTGAEVTYRGIGVGQVTAMEIIDGGVNVVLSIEKEHDDIPADTLALVGNKSAVGEQYVELQPRTSKGPYLKDGTTIDPDDTATPVSTTEILTNVNALVNSVDHDDLRTVVSEMGAAFNGAGPDIAKIIDTANEFIVTANDNFDVTTALIRDSNTVLRTQAAKGSAIRNFSRDLALFTDTLAGQDENLRTLLDTGAATSRELRTFLEQNQVNIGQLVNNLITTGEVVVKRLPGVQQLLVLYPYVVASGYTVAADKDGDGNYEAEFGLVLTQGSVPCTEGYNASERRKPFGQEPDGSDSQDNKPMDMDARCADPSKNPRGSQNIQRAPVGTYDGATGSFTWGGDGTDDRPAGDRVAYDGGAAQLLGEDSWKWMLLQPAMGSQD